MKPIKFKVEKAVLDLGVKIITAQISNVAVEKNNKYFEEYKNKELEKLKTNLKDKNYKDDPILQGFRDLHTKVGRSNREFVASPESLRWLFLKRDRFPQINTLVDIYNLISLKSGLALGAHDIEQIEGNVTLRITNGTETFIPLGKTEAEKVFSGEYSYVDDGNNVICRLEVLQVEPTKITNKTKNVFLIIQGNQNTTNDYIIKYAQEVCELITKYCGGSFVFLNDFD